MPLRKFWRTARNHNIKYYRAHRFLTIYLSKLLCRNNSSRRWLLGFRFFSWRETHVDLPNMLMDVDFDDTPNRCTTLVYYAWKIFTCLFLHVLLVTMVVLYCLLGAFAFERLESANEIEVSQIDKKNMIGNNDNIPLTRI